MVMPTKRVKVLITKSDMDAHDRGPKYVASLLRDAGIEVIFTRFRVPEEVVKIAEQEDVDVIGIGYYTPGYMYDIPIITEQLKQKGMNDVLIILGGIILDENKEELAKMGVSRIFGSTDPSSEIISYILSHSK